MKTHPVTKAFFTASRALSAQHDKTRQTGISAMLHLAVHDVSAIGRKARAVLLERFGAVIFPASREVDPPPSGELRGVPGTDEPADNVVRLPLRAG